MNKRTEKVVFGAWIIWGIFLCASSALATTHSATSGVTRVDTRAKNPVVFLHGYGGNAATWNNVTNLLMFDTNAFYPTNNMLVVEYAYSGSYSIGTWANAIASQIKSFSTKHGKPVDVVAHSMGGLILRSALAQGALTSSHVRRFIPIGTPHYGQWFGVDTQSKEMTYGSEFLWDLTKAWHIDGKKLSDPNVLCIAGRASTLDWHWDELVHYWSAALGNTDVRYVKRVHASSHEGLGDRAIYRCYGADGNQATTNDIRAGTADDLQDAVYVLVKSFLMEGTKVAQSALSVANGGVPTGLPTMGGTIFVQVVDGSGNPVEYSGNIINGTTPSIGLTSVLSRWHGDGNENTQKKGIELLTKLTGDIGIPAGTYTLDINPSKGGKYRVKNPPSVTVQSGRTSVLRVTAELATLFVTGGDQIKVSASGVINQGMDVTSSVGWTAISTVPWIVLQTTFGTGSASLVYDVLQNIDSVGRSGDIVITYTPASASGMSVAGAETESVTITITQGTSSMESPSVTSFNFSPLSDTVTLSWPITTNLVRVWSRASMVTGDWVLATGWLDVSQVVVPPVATNIGFYRIESE